MTGGSLQIPGFGSTTTFSAQTYTLQGGEVYANLGGGTVTVGGQVNLYGNIGASQIQVNDANANMYLLGTQPQLADGARGNHLRRRLDPRRHRQ